jgi:hypothetical protein
MTIKVTKFSKRPQVKFNHQRFIGFKIGSLPLNFAIHDKRKPITSWFNKGGYTWISEFDLTDSIAK